MSGTRRVLQAAATVVLAGLAIGPAPGAGQTSAHPPSPAIDSLGRRLEAVARRAQSLADHFRQMEASVRQSPGLQEEAGWASAEEIAWSAHLAGLVGAVAKQASALDGQLDAASKASGLTSRAGMGARLAALERDLGSLTRALESMRRTVEEMQGVVHGGEGHAHDP